MRSFLNRYRWVGPHSEGQADNEVFTNPVRRILHKRGVQAEAVEAFLNPSWESLHDPYLLKGMRVAIDRIQRAMAQGESIWIYGDYDVDGITSISLLVQAFRLLDYPVQYYIPDRHAEGYGLNGEAVEYLKSQGAQVIVTVDCGITSVKEAVLAVELGMDMIITDHHECQSEIPQAFAVINPKQDDCTYPYNMLAGVGIAFKMAMALLGDSWPLHRDELAQFAAFGTIADIAPLTGENRIITKKGLETLNQTTNPGFKALIEVSSLSQKTIGPGQVGFQLAPKINAAGRIDDPKLGVELLITQSSTRATEIANLLRETNDKRQALEKDILDAALAAIEGDPSQKEEKITLVCGKDWNSGVIGIVASRLVERYKRPAIVFAEVDGVCKGSARSIEGVDIFETLSLFKDLFMKFGGHEQAAGLSIVSDQYGTFERLMKDHCRTHIEDYLLLPALHIDEVIEISEITHQLLEDLQHMEPHGVGNPKPVFKMTRGRVEKKIAFGKEKQYLKLELAGDMRTFEALSFDTNGLLEPYKAGDAISLIFNLEMNNFRGLETIQFMIKDIRGYDWRHQINASLKSRFEKHLACRLLKHLKCACPFEVAPYAENPPTQQGSTQVAQAPKALNDEKALLAYVAEEWDGALSDTVICFGTLDPQVAQSYARTLVFQEDSSTERAPLTLQTIKKGVPDRDQLVTLYKAIRSKELEKDTLVAGDWLGIAILVEAGLIAYNEVNGFEVVPQNGTKVDILATETYQRLHTWQRS